MIAFDTFKMNYEMDAAFPNAKLMDMAEVPPGDYDLCLHPLLDKWDRTYASKYPGQFCHRRSMERRPA